MNDLLNHLLEHLLCRRSGSRSVTSSTSRPTAAPSRGWEGATPSPPSSTWRPKSESFSMYRIIQLAWAIFLKCYDNSQRNKMNVHRHMIRAHNGHLNRHIV